MEPVFRKLDPQLGWRPPRLFRAKERPPFERRELDVEVGHTLVKHCRGLYSPRSATISNTEALLFRTPHAIATLESALFLLRVLDEEPSLIQISIARAARKPFVPPLRIEVFRWSSPPHPEDVATVKASHFGPEVRAFTLAKTAVDCIRLRNRVGVDDAFAMADLLVGHHVTVDELLACAARYGATYPVRRYLGRRARRRTKSFTPASSTR